MIEVGSSSYTVTVRPPTPAGRSERPLRRTLLPAPSRRTLCACCTTSSRLAFSSRLRSWPRCAVRGEASVPGPISSPNASRGAALAPACCSLRIVGKSSGEAQTAGVPLSNSCTADSVPLPRRPAAGNRSWVLAFGASESAACFSSFPQ
jgi:hypothetical protein